MSVEEKKRMSSVEEFKRRERLKEEIASGRISTL